MCSLPLCDMRHIEIPQCRGCFAILSSGSALEGYLWKHYAMERIVGSKDMSRICKIATIGLMAIGLHGCAGMNSEECLSTDWSTIGYEDGANGYTGDRIGNYRKACGKHGVTPDLVAYQQGREQGLSEYCQPGRGFAVGSSGGQYRGVCDANQENSNKDFCWESHV